MKKAQKKIKKKYQPVVPASFLREVADAVDEAGPANDGRFNDLLKDFRKLSLKIKKDASGVSAKVKVEKDLGEDGPPAETQAESDVGDIAKPKYKSLKKQMKSVFREIGETLAGGDLPPRAAVENFIEQSNRMVDWTGYGNEHYDAYLAACARFADAVARADFDAAKDAYAVLARLRNECHKRYK